MSTPNSSPDPAHDDVPGRRRAFRRSRTGTDAPADRARARRRSKARRRVANVAGLMAALVLTGVVYSFFSPANAADEGTTNASNAVEAGRALYERSCITCHGDDRRLLLLALRRRRLDRPVRHDLPHPVTGYVVQ